MIDSVKALLFAPSASGREGVEGALESLKRMLASATDKHQSPGLALAYDALLLLLEFQQKIEEALPGEEAWLRATYRDLLAQIPGVWQEAARRPLLFAPFALPPPTKPNPVIIHNWAFASLRFAEALGQLDQVEAALREASANPELAPSIALARATRAVVHPITTADLEEARTADGAVHRRPCGLRGTPTPGRARRPPRRPCGRARHLPLRVRHPAQGRTGPLLLCGGAVAVLARAVSP